MAREILRSGEAIQDALSHSFYIAERRSLNASDAYLKAVEETYHDIAEMPGMGSPRDYGNPKIIGLRVWPVKGFRSYLIFYIATEDSVKIRRVLHGAQDIAAIFAPTDEE